MEHVPLVMMDTRATEILLPFAALDSIVKMVSQIHVLPERLEIKRRSLRKLALVSHVLLDTIRLVLGSQHAWSAARGASQMKVGRTRWTPVKSAQSLDIFVHLALQMKLGIRVIPVLTHT